MRLEVPTPDGDPGRFVRPELRDLRAYTLEQSRCVFKLDQNEAPWDLPRRMKVQMVGELLQRDWAAYPDFHADSLRISLGEFHGWPMEGILAGNGSNELLGVALELLISSGRQVLGCLPSFGLYEMFVRRAGGRSRFLAPRDDLEVPIDELRQEIDRDPRRPLILCSPNNPTGRAATPEDVESLLVRLEAPLLLDNAYGEFCRWDYRPLLQRHSNLMIFRTFSKAWSLGGMRLGYVLAHPALVAEMIKIKLPYNLNHAAVLAGLVALRHASVAQRRVRVLIGRRRQCREIMLQAGFEVAESEANFLLVGVDSLARKRREPVAQLVGRVRLGLAERGILVRDVSAYPGLGGHFRVGVGHGRALRALRQALKEILE